MHKTCLILSGLPRNVISAHPNIVKNIIEPNNSDVFFHTWLESGKQEELAHKLIELYKPKKYVMEPLKSWNNPHLDMTRMMASYGRAYTREYFIDAFYSAWYSKQQANRLKEEYRLQHNIVYDYTIRARFDMNYNMLIDCSKYDKERIYVSNRGLPKDMVEDLFGFGPNNMMNVYFGAFNNLDYIHSIRDKKDGIFCGEILLFETLKAFNIPYAAIKDLTCYRVND